MKSSSKTVKNVLLYIILIAISAAFLAPVFIVIVNSFKGKFYISEEPFTLPDKETFAGLENYTSGIEKTEFLSG